MESSVGLEVTHLVQAAPLAAGRVRSRTADVSDEAFPDVVKTADRILAKSEAFDVVVFLAVAVAKAETTGMPLP